MSYKKEILYLDYPYNILFDIGVESPTQDQINGLNYVISKLDDKSKEMLFLRYKNRLSFVNIGVCYGVSKQAAYDKINRILSKLSSSNHIKYGYEKYKKLKVEFLRNKQEEKRKDIINKYKGKETTISFLRELGYPYNLFYFLNILEPTHSQIEVLDSFIFKLSKTDRDILLLRFKSFCSYAEIGRKLNLSSEDVKIKISQNLYLLNLSLNYIDYNKNYISEEQLLFIYLYSKQGLKNVKSFEEVKNYVRK